ncbi:unnamed protein product [Trichobilharzia szidati]|nr:unnamed protein product [Trichobilharzia szidati]CAH8862849.1 unnamed protein product [Trichobilharzia szidati]
MSNSCITLLHTVLHTMSFWSLLLCFVLLSTSGIQVGADMPAPQWQSQYRYFTYTQGYATVQCSCLRTLSDAELRRQLPPPASKCPRCHYVG